LRRSGRRGRPLLRCVPALDRVFVRLNLNGRAGTVWVAGLEMP
jgi:hypothetical protein